jgi:endonuclease III
MKHEYAYKVQEIAEALQRKYKDFTHHNKSNPLDELLFIICSIKRSEKVYLSSYRILKKEFPSYQKLLEAPIDRISGILASSGLQNQKALMIKQTLTAITKQFGRITLNPLKKMSDVECEKFLLGLHGVGKKVAHCVMMYALGRQVFPVDSNCWRISCRLGWIKSYLNRNGYCSVKEMEYLQAKIPPDLRFSLHVNMVSHGREICKVGNPKCHKCLIKSYCHYCKLINYRMSETKTCISRS